MGWPDRKRSTPVARKDPEGRTFLVRSPWWELEGLTTPTDLRFVRQHFGPPDPVIPSDWSFSITGEVGNPLSLGLDALRRLPSRTVRAVTDCSGNDMAFFDHVEGETAKPSHHDLTLMGAGVIAAGEFTGIPLRILLEMAGVRPDAVSVRVQGFDRGTPDPGPGVRREPGEINYDKALPLEKALDPDTIVAWAHNGEYLRHVHGAPARLVVPGWSGNWWVKWMDGIEVLNDTPWCFYQDENYYYAESPDDPDRQPITVAEVRAVISAPKDGSTVPGGHHVVKGLAWSGMGTITGVQVSTDGGASWEAARIEESRDKWMWVRWAYEWDATESGERSIVARATDEAGRVQSLEPRRNHLKRNYDASIPISITVVE